MFPNRAGKFRSPNCSGAVPIYTAKCVAPTKKNQKMCIDRYLEEKIPIGHWWMDAGWYPCAPEGWVKTGTWEVDDKRFPKGLRAISDHAHTKGVKTIVWFEPERVHPRHLAYEEPSRVDFRRGAGGGLLNLGNRDAWNWLVNHVDKLMTDQGIDLYRQDFNMDPLDYWRKADAPDRQGITEIRHVEGYLAYWDELLKRHPNMFIDSCASGGQRNDLETMRTRIPLYGRLSLRADRHAMLQLRHLLVASTLWNWRRRCQCLHISNNMVPFHTRLPRHPQQKTRLRSVASACRSMAQGGRPLNMGDFYPLDLS